MDKKVVSWINSITNPEAKTRFWEVINSLQTAKQLSGSFTFQIPPRLKQSVSANNIIKGLMSNGVLIADPYDPNIVIANKDFDGIVPTSETSNNEYKNIQPSEMPLPPNVDWATLNDKYELKFGDGKKLEFQLINKPVAQYFRLLIEKHGVEIKHKDVPKVIEGINKQGIENLIKALRKKINVAGLSKRIVFKTDYKGGYKLLVTS